MASGNCPALIGVPGDFILFAGLLGLMRFFTVIAALDTGSSFEGTSPSPESESHHFRRNGADL